MLNILAHTEPMEGMISLTQAKPILAGLVLMILALLVIIIYLVNTWQPKSFSQHSKQKPAAVSSKKRSTK